MQWVVLRNQSLLLSSSRVIPLQTSKNWNVSPRRFVHEVLMKLDENPGRNLTLNTRLLIWNLLEVFPFNFLYRIHDRDSNETKRFVVPALEVDLLVYYFSWFLSRIIDLSRNLFFNTHCTGSGGSNPRSTKWARGMNQKFPRSLTLKTQMYEGRPNNSQHEHRQLNFSWILFFIFSPC